VYTYSTGDLTWFKYFYLNNISYRVVIAFLFVLNININENELRIVQKASNLIKLIFTNLNIISYPIQPYLNTVKRHINHEKFAEHDDDEKRHKYPNDQRTPNLKPESTCVYSPGHNYSREFVYLPLSQLAPLDILTFMLINP